MVFMNGEMVFSGNVASKKVEDLWDICWALAGKNDGTKDMLLTMIKTCLTNPAVQNSMKFLGLFVLLLPPPLMRMDMYLCFLFVILICLQPQLLLQH